jgi:hypothetical protein
MILRKRNRRRLEDRRIRRSVMATCRCVGVNRARISKLLGSPRIDFNEPILPGYVAWQAGRTTLFLLGS